MNGHRISFSVEDVERPVKLFEAGSYPDKGVEVTEDDLDKIVANTSEAPVGIEHVPTPFDGALGKVKGIFRKGKELWGTLSTPRYAWDLMEASNAKRVSVTIPKEKDRLLEVSVVSHPRVATAAIFATSSDGRLTYTGSVASMSWGGMTDSEVRDLLKSRLGKGPDDWETEVILKESSAIIRRAGSDTYQEYPFSIVDRELVLGEPVEVEQAWLPKRRESAEGDTTSMNADEVREIVKGELDGMMDGLEARFSKIIEPVVESAKVSAEAVAQFKGDQRATRIKGWLDAGKLTTETAAHAEAILAAGGENAKTFSEFMDKLEAPAKSTTDGDGGDAKPKGEIDKFSDVEDAKTKILAGLGMTTEDVEKGGKS